MRIDETTGLLDSARYVRSPNCDARPAGADPELVVVHGISLPPGEYGGPWIDQFFTNVLDVDAHAYFREIGQLRVSAHALIRRTGEVVQYVPFHMRAWHAGESSFCGRAACNDFSIGIELEGADDEPYRTAQYVSLAELCRALETRYPTLRSNPIVGHSDIAPGRKTDPGPYFEWTRLAGLLRKMNADITVTRET